MQAPIELRIRKDTRFLIESSVVFGFEVPKHGCRDDPRNFKSTTLADRRAQSATELIQYDDNML